MKKSWFSKNTQDFRKYSCKSTFFNNINFIRECQLFSKKWTYFEKINFSRKSTFFEKFNFFRKTNIFLCCGTQFVNIKARRTAIPVSNAFYAQSWTQSSPQTPPNEWVVEEICLPQNPRNHKSVTFCNVFALSSTA